MKDEIMQIKKEFQIVLSLILILFISSCGPSAVTTALTLMQATTQEVLPLDTLVMTETSTPTPMFLPSETPTMNNGVSEPFDFIQMIDETQGWGIAAQLVLRTEDGGKTWSDVTPIEMKTVISTFPTPAPQGVNLIELKGTFIDAQTAWVAVPGLDKVTIFHTVDGGQTWQTNELVASTSQQAAYPIDIISFTFINAQMGWLLRSTIESIGHESIELYQTKDNGASWRLIAEAKQNISGKETGSITTNGQKTGISFRNTTNGWLTGSSQENAIFLYRSVDGGSKWNRQELAIPNGYTATGGSAQSYPVAFFDDNNGVMPVYLGSGSPSINLVFYITKDGGNSWSSTTPLSSPTNDFIWSWPDALHGFAAENQTGILYITVDGGKTWSKSTLGGVALSQLDFVSATTGWALANGNLFKTIDGGMSWVSIYLQ